MIDKSRIGFFSPSLGLYDTDECLEFVKARGGLLQAWTLPGYLSHERKPGLDIDKLNYAVKNRDVKVSSMSGYMDWTENRGNAARRSEFKKIVNQCKECNSNIICTETGRDYDDKADKRAWGLLVDSMKDLCYAAQEHMVYIAIEMGGADLVFGAEDFLNLQQMVQSPFLKVNFDPANLIRRKIDPLRAARELKNDVVQVHLKDADGGGMRPLTEGAVDFEALVGFFESNSYSGNYIIEAEYQSANRLISLSEDYDNIVKLLC